MRSGVIAQKVGMTRVFTETGEHIPVTVLKLGNCQVLGHRTTEKNGYVALQLGSGTRKTVYLPKAERGQFAVAKVEPKRKVAEFRVVGRRADPGRRRDPGRPFRGRPVRRRHRHLGRQGFCRRHEALEFRRPARHPRRVGLASFDRFDRRPSGSRQDLQEQEDARPHGRRSHHHAQPARGADRRRARPDPGRRRRSRLQGRLDRGARRRQEGVAEGRAEARQVPPGRWPAASRLAGEAPAEQEGA